MNIAARLRQVERDETVFTLTDMQSLLNIYDKKKLYNAVGFAVSRGALYRITEGIFALDKSYSKESFANKYRRPSYISLFTVLAPAGIVFQPYPSTYAVTNRSEEFDIDGQKYVYRKVRDPILLNPLGVIQQAGVSKALPERALCDSLYLDGDQHFDNLRNVDWQLMRQLHGQVYSNHQVIKSFIDKYASTADK